MTTAQHIIVQRLPLCLVCVALCLLLGASLRLSQLSERILPEPGLEVRGEAVHAAVPQLQQQTIKPFSHYNVNSVNPFLPFHLRSKTLTFVTPTALESEKKTSVVITDEISTASNEQESVLDSHGLAVPAVSIESLPRVVGVISVVTEGRVLVRYAGEQRHLRVGDRIGIWTMTAYKQGGTSCTDVDGSSVDIPMGQTPPSVLSLGSN